MTTQPPRQPYRYRRVEAVEPEWRRFPGWRLLGVKIGRRVFDDGCTIVERTLVSVGNAGSALQCHSLEDGVFKSDHFETGGSE
jgi:hypothetical protein